MESSMNIEYIKNANTKLLGKEIEYFEEIPSTHTYAKEIANSEEKSGKLIFAEEQTAGIGTNGRKWHTGKHKNIAMTLILKPTCNVDVLNGLTVEIAETMKKAIHDLYGYELKIKEPNDLMISGKKIAGILTQVSMQSDKINYLVISLGFNVNEEAFSEETKSIATSLKVEYQKNFNREEIICRFLEILEKKLNKKQLT